MHHKRSNYIFYRAATRPFVLIVLLLLLCGCSQSVVTSFEQSPKGRNNEVRGWTTTATENGPRHKVRLTVDLDPAKYMGWARTNIQYRIVLDVRLEGPNGDAQERTLVIPVTEARQVGEDKARNRIRLAYGPAGKLLPNGFHRLEPFELMSFKPVPGVFKLTVRMRVMTGANRNALWTLRYLRVELLSSEGAAGLLTDWTELPPEGLN